MQCVFYLLLRALDTIEDDMDLGKFEAFCDEDASTPLLAKQRLVRTFYSLLDRATAASYPLDKVIATSLGVEADRALLSGLPELLQAFHDQLTNAQAKAAVVAVTKEMGEGMAEFCGRDLRDGTSDVREYDRYCHYVAGTVGYGLTVIFHAFALERGAVIDDEWDGMGKFLQRTNITRDVCEDAADGRGFWPQSMWKARGATSLRTLDDVDVLDAMVRHALELFPTSVAYLARLEHAAVFTFCALPQVMAVATLAECYHNPNVFTGVVKIRTGAAASIMDALMVSSLAVARPAFAERAGHFLEAIKGRAAHVGDAETVAACNCALEALDDSGMWVEPRSVVWVNLVITLVGLGYVSWVLRSYLAHLGIESTMADITGAFSLLMLMSVGWTLISRGPARRLVANVVGKETRGNNGFDRMGAVLRTRV